MLSFVLRGIRMTVLNKNKNETELQYVWRLCSAKDSGSLDMTWDELTEVLNKNLREDESEYYGSSAYRKKYQQAKAFRDEVFVHEESEDYQNDIMALKRELERAKVQFRDERNAWQKQNYIAARAENKLDLLEEKLSEIGKIEFSNCDNITVSGNTDLLVILSDLHIGQCFSSVWGEYNSTIAQKRLNQLLYEIVTIGRRHQSENVYVSIQGDLISGSIHKTLAITNRENVIEQIKLAAELITSFCYELSKYFNKVCISNVSGNHSRIDKKEDALHDERLDDLISWIVESSLKHIDNIIVSHRNYDNGISDMDIRGKSYIAVHGDYDSFTRNGVANLVLMLGFAPYAVTFGHMHTCAVDECNGIKMIRGGSLAGSGDPYTVEKRLSGKPSQMVCVCSEKGVEAYYTVELD